MVETGGRIPFYLMENFASLDDLQIRVRAGLAIFHREFIIAIFLHGPDIVRFFTDVTAQGDLIVIALVEQDNLLKRSLVVQILVIDGISKGHGTAIASKANAPNSLSLAC